MSTYDFEPDPDDFGPEPAHIAEIAGWKRDQAENLANQCKLVDQIAALTKERDALAHDLVIERARKTIIEQERDALKDAARLALDALLAEVRTTANQITYTNLLTVIAALKAVL